LVLSHAASRAVPCVQRRGAWLHVDGIWGAALAYSTDPTTRAFLQGLECADSVSLGPQKWLFTPRLCALTLFPKLLSSSEYDATLAAAMPYSAKAGGDDDEAAQLANRGQWGLQGSRRADCLPLWATLQVLGREGVGRYVDDSIALTQAFHDMTLARLGTTGGSGALHVVPTHTPQLNLLNLRVNGGEKDLALALQEKLHARGEAWVSVSPVGGEHVLRCVLANPELTLGHCEALLDSLDE
jgi:glutamate/tyrosine decarboxylase-like PLP-dependent enzyme